MELKTVFSSCLIIFPFFPSAYFSVFVNTRECVIFVVIREVCLVEIWIGHLRNRLEPSCGWTEQQDGQQGMQCRNEQWETLYLMFVRPPFGKFIPFQASQKFQFLTPHWVAIAIFTLVYFLIIWK